MLAKFDIQHTLYNLRLNEKKWLATFLLITMKVLKKKAEKYFEDRMDIPTNLKSYFSPLISTVYWFRVFHLPRGNLVAKNNCVT